MREGNELAEGMAEGTMTGFLSFAGHTPDEYSSISQRIWFFLIFAVGVIASIGVFLFGTATRWAATGTEWSIHHLPGAGLGLGWLSWIGIEHALASSAGKAGWEQGLNYLFLTVACGFVGLVFAALGLQTWNRTTRFNSATFAVCLGLMAILLGFGAYHAFTR